MRYTIHACEVRVKRNIALETFERGGGKEERKGNEERKRKRRKLRRQGDGKRVIKAMTIRGRLVIQCITFSSSDTPPALPRNSSVQTGQNFSHP